MDTKNPAYRHGHAGKGKFSPEYHSWACMIQRCTNKNRDYYEYYGGRGISVHAEWRNFETFLRDMGPRPEGTSLDRIDPNGNYTPENCRWATHKEQRLNVRPGKWANAMQEMLTVIQNGAHTYEEVRQMLRSKNIVLHDETVKELSRRLSKQNLLSIDRQKSGKVRICFLSLVKGNSFAQEV